MLKLKRQLQESAWKGRIIYGTREVQLQDPSQVEKEILKGRRPGFLQVWLSGRSLAVPSPSLPPGHGASSSQAFPCSGPPASHAAPPLGSAAHRTHTPPLSRSPLS